MRFKILSFFAFAFFAINPGVVIAACSCGEGVCGANQYCHAWYEDMGNGGNWNYNCDPCGNGEVPNNECDGCVAASQICSDYNDTCPSVVAPGKKCKEIINGCGVAAPNCHKYDVCDTSTGNIESPVVTGNCHLEGPNNTCTLNTRACQNFYAGGISSSSSCDWMPTTGVMACTGGHPSAGNNAIWDGTKWNVDACKCDTGELNIPNKNCIGVYRLKPAMSNNVSTIDDEILYSCQPDGYFCWKCGAGKCPADIRTNSSNNQCYDFISTSANYVACSCSDVQVDYYTMNTSYNIPYNVSPGTNDCPIPCPSGTGTGGVAGSISIVGDGADVCTGPNTTTTVFSDGTGDFRLSGELCSAP